MRFLILGFTLGGGGGLDILVMTMTMVFKKINTDIDLIIFIL